MDGSYGEEETQLSVKKSTWMQWFKDNWLVVLVVVLAVAGLVYWFYFRGASAGESGASSVSPASPAEKFTIHRLRGGMY